MHVLGVEATQADQGFLDHRGVYVGRKAAMIVAYQHKQVTDEFEEGGDLYSEHLW
jgi:hypothetical protein